MTVRVDGEDWLNTAHKYFGMTYNDFNDIFTYISGHNAMMKYYTDTNHITLQDVIGALDKYMAENK